ncbi:hypothetical protein NZL82_17285 [Sphingomonas sanguinis]|jgi:hypothetical protein|uniref:hypothetical protein n=1 Tax=Sphingomonas sp. LC-1 TaxID=3110957 RepID=UPI0021BA3FAB|nr:hypothetical protein [Sphingomonas sp. LC-1]MCT8003630.1 hypothetical protein [Sphingomonas sp. LC-1]
MRTSPDQARLAQIEALLQEALALLDEQGLSVAAAHLDGVIQMVEAASVGNGHIIR